VVGVEGDFAWANNSATNVGIPGAEFQAPGTPGGDTSTVKETWDAGIRARLGYLITPSVMVFGTGGVAWTHAEASAHCGSPSFWCLPEDFNLTSTATKTMTGWSVGGGLEYMIAPNWMLRGEYRYTDYGTFNYVLFPGLPAGAPGADSLSATSKLHTSTALFGVAYKFGGPVVAKY
jgi:outer membrane immunogenic protein